MTIWWDREAIEGRRSAVVGGERSLRLAQPTRQTATPTELERRRRWWPLGAMRLDGRSARGQSLVELAVAMPIMLLIMLGTIDLGRAFFDYIEMRNAVREGAAYAARSFNDTAGIRQRITDHGVPTLDAPATITCSGNCTVIDGVGVVTVSATRTFTPVTTGFLQTYFGIPPFMMTATASMRAMT